MRCSSTTIENTHTFTQSQLSVQILRCKMVEYEPSLIKLITDTDIVIMQKQHICQELEVYWCNFEETVGVFVSIPPVHFYVICYMALLSIGSKLGPCLLGNVYFDICACPPLIVLCVHLLLNTLLYQQGQVGS